MKIKMADCLKLCAVLLQSEDVLALLSNEQQSLNAEQLAEAQKQSRLLQRCANLVVSEIAAEYVPLKAEQNFTTEDGNIRYSLFEKKPVNIYSVKKSGFSCRFKLYPSEIITESGSVTVSFSYMPDNAEADGELEFEEGKINSRIIAYGTAAEYCIISGMYEEAVIWDKRYKDSLLCAVKSQKPIQIRERLWC